MFGYRVKLNKTTTYEYREDAQWGSWESSSFWRLHRVNRSDKYPDVVSDLFTLAPKPASPFLPSNLRQIRARRGCDLSLRYKHSPCPQTHSRSCPGPCRVCYPLCSEAFQPKTLSHTIATVAPWYCSAYDVCRNNKHNKNTQRKA